MSWEWFFCSLSLYCTYRERERERHPSGYVCTHNRLSMGATIYTRIVIRKKRDEEGVRTSLILSQMSLIFLLCSHNIYIRGIVINTPDQIPQIFTSFLQARVHFYCSNFHWDYYSPSQLYTLDNEQKEKKPFYDEDFYRFREFINIYAQSFLTT